MEEKVLGIHHITAIAGNAKRNFEFYTTVLGLRLVKKTVNFDDPHTYHFYFGDEVGTPGTILTFFPWERVKPGRKGTGMPTEVVYSVPTGSFDFWKQRFNAFGVKVTDEGIRFGEPYLSFEDPDGLSITLVVASHPDNRKPWETSDVKAAVATRGFHSTTLMLKQKDRTAAILTDIFGYTFSGQEGNRFRYVNDAAENASIIDIVEAPDEPVGIYAGGSIHHVAFRVRNSDMQMRFRERILEKGFAITPQIDRNYFFSLYFREPGGVLFELATDEPGFAIDESVQELGSSLKLPPQYEPQRARIEEVLPSLA